LSENGLHASTKGIGVLIKTKTINPLGVETTGLGFRV
jgi:hypothetical protein